METKEGGYPGSGCLPFFVPWRELFDEPGLLQECQLLDGQFLGPARGHEIVHRDGFDVYLHLAGEDV